LNLGVRQKSFSSRGRISAMSSDMLDISAPSPRSQLSSALRLAYKQQHNRM
jgi:hypothetical protein